MSFIKTLFITILLLILLSINLANMAIADTYRYDNRIINNTRITDQGGFQHWAVGAAWGSFAKQNNIPLGKSILIMGGVSIIKEAIDAQNPKRTFCPEDILFAVLGTYMSWGWTF